MAEFFIIYSEQIQTIGYIGQHEAYIEKNNAIYIINVADIECT